MKFKIKKVIKESTNYQSLTPCPYDDSRKRTECRWGFAAAGVLICCPEDGTFLLQHRHDGTWGYPGGGIHPPEETGLGKRFLLPIPESAQLKDNDPIYEETAFQELEEELGWKINNYKLVDYSISDTKGFRYKTSFITITKEEKDNANLRTGSWETVSFGWYTLKDLAKLKLVNGFGEEQINKLKNVIGLNESIKESKMKLTNEDLKRIIKEETQAVLFKPGLLEHVKTKTPLHENIFRHGSDCYFNTIRQGRHFYKMGLYECINEEERDMLEHSDLGEFALYEGEMVPLDFPMLEEEVVEEAKKKKKKKNPPLNKPMKNSGGGKKWKVYVRSKSGGVKKVTYGDSKGGLKGNWNNAEAKKSFAARHDCKNKKDKTQAGYWACRANRDFGGQKGGYW